MKLDVGCGYRPSGDVNCDLYVKDIFNHRNNRYDTLNIKAIPNFVLCHALHLPFKDKSFKEAFCGHVIEHLETPAKLIKELIRVTIERVTIETVHRLGEAMHFKRQDRLWFKQHHISKFNLSWFTWVAKANHWRAKNNYVISWIAWPNEIFTIFRFPYCIGSILESGGD